MKNTRKGFVNIVLIGMVATLLAIGGYFVLVKKSEPIIQQPTSTPTQTETPISLKPIPKSPTPIVDKTENWKTYTNTDYGFEIKIPSDWTVESGNSKGGGGLTFYSQASRIKNLAKIEECKNKSNSGFVPCVLAIEDMHFAGANYSFDHLNNKQETINGVEWTAIGGTYEGLAYQTKQGKSLFYFSVVGYPENKEKLAKILSTFKFTK